MAWLDFIKQIRQDEEEEEKRSKKGGVKNSIFGFLDDVLDNGGRAVERTADIFQDDSERDKRSRLDRGLPELYEDQQAASPQDVKVPFAVPEDTDDENRNIAEKIWDQLNMTDNDRTFKNEDAKNSRSITSQLRRNANTTAAAVARSGAGMLQDASGLVDLLSKGEGTSRVTDMAEKFGKDVDELVEDKGYSTGGYKTLQVPHQLAGFLIPGLGAEAAAAKISTMIPKGGKVLTSAAKFTSFLDDVIANGSKAEKVAATTVKAATKGSNIANVGVDAAQNAGYRTSKEQDNSPLTLATDVGLSVGTQGLLTGGGKVAGKVVDVGKDALRTTGRIRPHDINDSELLALSRWREVMGTGGATDMDEGVYQGAKAAAGKLGIDYRDTDALDRVLGDFRTYETRKLERGVKPVYADETPYEPPTTAAAAVEPPPTTQQFQDIVARPVAPAAPTAATSPDLLPGPGEKRQRSFLQTAQTGEGATPEANAVVQSITPQKYTVQKQQPVMDAAKREVEENYDQALQYVKDPASVWDDRKSATLQQLAVKARNEGREAEFKDFLEQIDVEGRGAGRANAILAAWAKLSPEGVVQFADRQIQKFTEKSGKGVINKISKGLKDKPEDIAAGLKEEVEGAVQITDDVVKNAVRKASNAEDKTVGEKVAKNIETYVSPQKKKKVDELVTELSKKIKQELIEKKAKAQPKSAADVLRSVFGRNKEALEAFPEAQSILRERFADNPAVLSQLDDFFGASLDMPAAKSTVTRAIRETMKEQEAKISEIIKTSWANQQQSVDEVAAALTREGFDADSAAVIAREVNGQMARDIGAAKASVLDRLMKDAPERVKVTFEDKVAKLSNLGALDDADYLSIARKQLDLPELDTASANKISKLAQDMQSLPEGEEKNRVVAEIMQTIADTMPATAKEKFNAFRYQNLLSSPRTQLRNVVANTFNTLITRPATLFTGAVGDTASSLTTGKPRERLFAELPAYYQGLYRGFFDSHDAMRAAWGGSADITNPDLVEQFGKGGIEAARMRNLPKRWTVVSRMMEAEDRMFSGMIAGGEYAAQIARGVPEEQAKKAAHEMAEYSLLRQALDPKNATEQGKFLSGIDQASQWILDGANAMPGGRWIVPFVRTPLNFAKQWLEFSPVGLADAALGKGMSAERRIESLNKGLLGTAVVGIGATLAADDKITWSVPENQTDRDLFYAEGKKPYSIKIDGKWVPLINFGPFGMAMGLPAAVKHNFGDSPESTNDNIADKVLATTLDLGEMLSQQTFLNGISNVIEAVQGGGGKQVEKVLAGLVSQAVPLSGMVRYISTAIDPTYREAEGFMQVLQKDTPFLSKGLKPQENSETGEPVRRNASDYVAPYSIGMPNANPAKQEKTEMAADFYRSMRKGNNDRTKTNDAITEAMLADNPEEVGRLTVQHNQQVLGEVEEFLKKYGKQLSGQPDLLERFVGEIESSLISIDQRSVNTRLQNQYKKKEFSDMLSR